MDLFVISAIILFFFKNSTCKQSPYIKIIVFQPKHFPCHSSGKNYVALRQITSIHKGQQIPEQQQKQYY